MNRSRDAIEVFLRLYRMMQPLGLSDETPMRDFVPGVWPTYGDLRNLCDTERDSGSHAERENGEAG